jgi:hypothetical protein
MPTLRSASVANCDRCGRPTVPSFGSHLCTNVDCVAGCAAGGQHRDDCYECGQPKIVAQFAPGTFYCANKSCGEYAVIGETPRIVATHSMILQHQIDAGLKRVIDEIRRQLQPAQKNLLKVAQESRAEVAALAATVTEMRDAIKSLSAQNEGLRNELQTAHEKLSELTRAATVLPPPPPPPPPPATPTPPPPALSKRKRTGSQSPRQPTKQARDTSPTPTLMHSKHAGPVASVTTGPTQPPPTTSEPPRVDSVETEEGWKKVERKRWKGKREKKVGTRSAGGVPTWADMARGGGVCVNVFIGAGADYTKPKARRPAGKGKKKQQGHQRPASSSMAG